MLVLIKANLHIPIDPLFWNIDSKFLHDFSHYCLDSSEYSYSGVAISWSFLKVYNDKFTSVFNSLDNRDGANWVNSQAGSKADQEVSFGAHLPGVVKNVFSQQLIERNKCFLKFTFAFWIFANLMRIRNNIVKHMIFVAL